jgi:hypothetical protein
VSNNIIPFGPVDEKLGGDWAVLTLIAVMKNGVMLYSQS